MRTPVFVALEAPEFSGARTNDAYPRVLSEVLTTTRPMVRFTLGNRESLMFAVPATSDLRSVLAARRVIKLTPEGEPPSEWLVSRVVEAVAPGNSAALVVECDPIWAVMGDVGIIEEVLVGGQSFSNLGGLNGTPANYLATYVIPALQRRNVNWIELGTVDPTVQFDLSWDAQTPLQVLNTVASAAAAEWEFERDDAYSRYLLNLVDRVGSSAPIVRVREGLDVLQVGAQRTRERLYTAIRPQGELATGSEERANIGFNTWRVTAKSGDTLTLEPHAGGIGPVLEDSQHVGLYLESPDGDFWEIVDSTAPDIVVLETGGGADFAVNDDTMIVADDQGTLLTEIRSPSGIAAYGYVQGTTAANDAGHRNYIKNPAFADWPTLPSVIYGKMQSYSSPNMTLKDLPPNYLIKAGDTFTAEAVFAGGIEVAADATTDGSGNVTISVSGASFSFNANVRILRCKSATPVGYATILPSFIHAFDRGEEIDQAAKTNGTNTVYQASIDNLPANFYIPAGTYIKQLNTVTHIPATANSGGAVTLSLYGATTILADNTDVSLFRPAINGTGYGIGFWDSPNDQRQPIYTLFGFRSLSGTDRVTATARWFAYNRSAVAFTSSDGPRVLIEDSSGSSTIATGDRATSASFDYDGFSGECSVSHDLSSGVYRLRFEPSLVSPGGRGSPQIIQSIQLTLGSEPLPFVTGSAATRLFQVGQLALAASRRWPSTYTATVAELASAWGLPVDSPAFSLGAYIHLVAPSAGIDEILRVTEIQYDPFDPDEKMLTLDTDPDRITQLTAKQRGRALFVDVEVQVDNDGRARETVLVSESPPVAVPGVNRFVVEAGTVPASDLLNIQILE